MYLVSSICHKEYCIYVKTVVKKGETTLIIVAVYVDDLAIASKDTEEINRLKVQLCAKFKMKDYDLTRTLCS